MEIDLYYNGDVEEFFEGVIENSGGQVLGTGGSL